MAVFGIGMLVLAGWFFDVAVLRSWHPGLTTVKPSTAVCLALLGASLWLCQSKRTSRRFRISAQLGTLAAILIALGSLLEAGLGRDLGFDHFLFREASTAFSLSAPGRMTPMTALLFFFAGLSLLGFAVRDRRGASLNQGLAVAASVCALLGVLGYAYGALVLLGHTVRFAAMALPTAVAGCLLSAGLLCLRPDCGFMTILTSDGPGGRVTRRLLPAALVAPGALHMITLALGLRQTLDPEVGAVIDATMTAALLVAPIFLTARSLDRLDAEGRRREEALRTSEGRFRSVVDTATDAIITADHDGRVVVWNEAAAAIFGYPSREILGRPVSTIVPDQFRRAHDQAIERVAFTGQPAPAAKTVESTGRRKDGSEFPIELSLAAWNTAGAVHYTAIIRDITALEQVEAELRSSEAQFRQLFDEAPTGYHELDIEGRMIRVNRTELETLGYSAEEMVGRHVWEFAWDPGVSRQAVLKKLAGTSPIAPSHERVYRKKDGTSLSALIQDRLLLDGGGRITGIRSSFQDISARKVAESERERLIAELQTTLAEVKVLKGFIPICASCKQIRDDQGFWDQIENYITRHSDAHFSHGICPDCMKKLYPEM
jgi:PAS domain S-box-containing protein